MTKRQKEEILDRISAILDELAHEDAPKIDIPDTPVPEMLTIKECSELVSGLSEHTVRKLVARGEIASLRTGDGRSGKILVPKSSLLGYLEKLDVRG